MSGLKKRKPGLSFWIETSRGNSLELAALCAAAILSIDGEDQLHGWNVRAHERWGSMHAGNRAPQDARFRNSACSPPISSNPKGIRLLDLKQLSDLLEHFGYLEVVAPRHGYYPSNALRSVLQCIRCAMI